MMKKYYLFSILLLLSACDIFPVISSGKNNLLENTISPTILATIQPEPTNTVGVETNTMFTYYEEVCPEIISREKANNPGGTLIIRNGEGVFKYNLDDMTTKQVNQPDDEYIRLTFSPDYQSFAAWVITPKGNYTTRKWLISSTNTGTRNFPYQYDRDPIWLDNKTVYTLDYDESRIPKKLIIIDTLNNQQKSIDLPFFDPSIDPRWYSWTIVPNSSVTFAVYPSTQYQIGNPKVQSHWAYSLVDLSSMVEINAIPSIWPYNREKYPVWSSTGDKFYTPVVISNEIHHDDIFSMNVFGEVQRITFFTDYLDYVDISRLSISPDNSRLSFFIRLDPIKPLEEYLVILDISTQHVTKYCLRGNIDSIGTTCYNGHPPIWSFDGEYLAITSCLAPNDNEGIHTDLIILDINANVYQNITQNYYLDGWLINTQ